ncbi:GPW/gp25 family protein [Kaistia granuli]|uniref:GPW/gp25 family protein n=1 Tax=Kaistia granuli TaxID=363259 RepID=UPI00037CBF73|nr:GPW/gp25 family protein [Kaistia granuli]
MATEPLFLDFPFAIDERGRSALTNADEHVRDLIRQVIFTNPGERVNRPEFGSGVKQLTFAPASDALAAATEQLIHGSLLRWLDAVILVERVSVNAVDERLEVSVVYRRRTTGERMEDTFVKSEAV